MTHDKFMRKHSVRNCEVSVTVGRYTGVDALVDPDIPDLKQRAPEAHWDILAIVQAQLVNDTDTGLAPAAQSCPATGGRGADSGLGRGQGRGQSGGRHRHQSWVCRSTIF